MIASIITYVLVILAAVSATAILIVKEVFHAALGLIVCLLCIAGIFVTFNAEFLAVVQIIVYAGGVLLLIVFGIMLTVRGQKTNDITTLLRRNVITSSIIGLVLFGMFIYVLSEYVPGNYPPYLSPETIGIKLVTDYAIEFELAGVLLLVSLIAAIVAATNLRKS